MQTFKFAFRYYVYILANRSIHVEQTEGIDFKRDTDQIKFKDSDHN
jgi:hypothetical protein